MRRRFLRHYAVKFCEQIWWTTMSGILAIFILFLQIFQYSFGESCHKDLGLNWTVSIDDSPVVSSPLNVKLNKNDNRKLIVATLGGSVSVIDTTTGEEDPQWPVHFPEEAFYAGPLLYDVNQDGSMDILLTSADGKVMFLSQNGTLMTSYIITLPRLMVRRKWYIVNVDVRSDISPENNTRFITVDDFIKRYHTNFANHFLPVDLHILSTPVIGDFTGDGINSDLIIPVNYYFDNDIQSDKQRLQNLTLDKSELDFYQASGIIVIDLRRRAVIYNTTFELTIKSKGIPGYVLSSPTVFDFDGNHGGGEVIIGSVSGKIHACNKDGQLPWSFDISDAISGQIAVGDVNTDGNLEIIAVDGSANVVCYSEGKIMWEAAVSGTVTAGAQLYDIDNDRKLEVVIATNDGYIWVLDSQTGHILPNWPVMLGNEIHSHVLFQKQYDDSVDMVVMSGGNLNILSGNSQCLEVIPTEELSYTPVIYDHQNMAFIISTADGAVLSFHQLGTNKSKIQDELGIAFTNISNELHTVTTASFKIEFEIFGHLSAIPNLELRVVVSYSTENGVEHEISKYSKAGIYSMELQSPRVPMRTYILIELCTRYKQCSQDRIFMNFHPGVKEKLMLYAMLPLLVMVSLLLLIHGYPEGDLLPTWESSKD